MIRRSDFTIVHHFTIVQKGGQSDVAEDLLSSASEMMGVYMVKKSSSGSYPPTHDLLPMFTVFKKLGSLFAQLKVCFVR